MTKAPKALEKPTLVDNTAMPQHSPRETMSRVSPLMNFLTERLGGVISPMQGISPSDLKIDLLCERIARGGVKEVILAISTSVEGETTLFYLMNRLRQFPGLKVTSIARGIGFGDELEYVDELTITHALMNRREIE